MHWRLKNKALHRELDKRTSGEFSRALEEAVVNYQIEDKGKYKDWLLVHLFPNDPWSVKRMTFLFSTKEIKTIK